MYKKTVLPNGLKLITHKMRQRNSIALGFWFKVGGRYESDIEKGVAHFLEHIVFKGSKKYSCQGIKETVEGVGGSFNAFTSEEQTCFYAKIPSKYLVQTFDVLADMTVYPKISKADVEKEKTVILEEIKMYRDLPQYFVLEALDELLWPNHPLGKNLAGSEKSVGDMINNDLKSFFSRHYGPSNMVIAACGDLEHKEIEVLVKEYFLKLQAVQSFKYLSANKEKHNKPKVKFINKKIEQMHIALGVLAFDENSKDRYALGLLSTILGGNMSSRLFNELREKRGLAYSVYTSIKLLSDTGAFGVRAGVDPNKAFETIDLMIKELDKIASRKVKDDELVRAKEYLLGQLSLNLEDTMEHMLWIGESIIARDKIEKRLEIIKEFEKIGPSDLLRVAKDVLRKKGFQLAIVGPHKKEIESRIKSLFNQF